MRNAKSERTRNFSTRRFAILSAVLAALILTITCGKKAPPAPPIPIVPKAALENKIIQTGASFLFAFKIPPLNTDDRTPTELGKIVIYRLRAPRIAPAAPTQTAPTQTAPQTQTSPQTQTAPQTQPIPQTQPQTQTAPQTQPETQPQTQTAPQTQPQTQPLPPEMPRALSALEFEEQGEKIAEIPAEQIDSYMRDDYFIYQDKREIKADSEDLRNWFYYGVKLFNKKNKENEFGRLIALFPEIVPEAPKKFSANITEKTILLTWEPVKTDIAGKPLADGTVSYNVYRGTHANFAPLQPLNPLALTTPTFSDTSFQSARPYYYFVRAFVSTHKREQESSESNVIFVFPQDIYPPSAPQELNVVAAREGMVLIWAPNPEEDVAGYNVYRKVEGEAEYKKHNTKLVRETTYSDPDVKPEIRYYYQVTAVDNAPLPNESPRSTEISEVQRNR
jgi:hypothetical protein